MKRQEKVLEAARLESRTHYDLEMLQETGFCAGVENYARPLSRRGPGTPPHTLLDYFPEDYLLLVDESHMTLPQVRGMYHGDPVPQADPGGFSGSGCPRPWTTGP